MRNNGKTPRPNGAEVRMARSLDTLSEYDKLAEEVLPLLRKAIAEGWTHEQIQAHPVVHAALVARQVTIALTDRDGAKALAATKELRDRIEGRAIERKEVRHQFENLTDAELDAKLAAMEASTDDSSEQAPH